MLELYGIPVAASAYLPVDGSASSLQVLYPFVAKVDHPEIVHKSDVGGVRLNVKDCDELQALLQEWSEKFPGMRGIQVQQQVTGDLEMIVGATQDPALGHSILVGWGGTLVELLHDVSFGHVPLRPTDPDRMLSSLQCLPLLNGYRGSQPANVKQLRKIIMQVNQMLLDFPQICEMDMNPLIYDAARCGFYVVDARMKLS